MTYLFEWDPIKAAANLAKHGVRFEVAATVFLHPERVEFDASRDGQGEVRAKVFGLADGQLCAVVFTRRGAAIRLISARRASQKEYERHASLHARS